MHRLASSYGIAAEDLGPHTEEALQGLEKLPLADTQVWLSLATFSAGLAGQALLDGEHRTGPAVRDFTQQMQQLSEGLTVMCRRLAQGLQHWSDGGDKGSNPARGSLFVAAVVFSEDAVWLARLLRMWSKAFASDSNRKNTYAAECMSLADVYQAFHECTREVEAVLHARLAVAAADEVLKLHCSVPCTSAVCSSRDIVHELI